MIAAIVLGMLLGGGLPAAASEQTPAPESPWAAPDPPDVAIKRVAGTNNVELSWLHVLEANYYDVWRGTAPYFNPPGQGNKIKEINAAPYGQGQTVRYTDTGADNYPGDGTIPTVQVIGDVATNYFWVVRSRNTGGEISDNSNRVGEFDFRLAAGS
jgi:hypothetical protein